MPSIYVTKSEHTAVDNLSLHFLQKFLILLLIFWVKFWGDGVVKIG